MTAVMVFLLTYLSAWVTMPEGIAVWIDCSAQVQYLRKIGESLSRYARANGRYPDSLAELATEEEKARLSLDESEQIVPLDFFDQPLQYQRMERRCRVYYIPQWQVQWPRTQC